MLMASLALTLCLSIAIAIRASILADKGSFSFDTAAKVTPIALARAVFVLKSSKASLSVTLSISAMLTKVDILCQPLLTSFELTLVDQIRATMTTFTDRLNQAMREAGLSQADLHRKSGYTRAAISKWVNGQSEPKDILKLARILGVSPEWLQTGKESRALDTSLPSDALPMPARRLAPVISYVQAGNWAELVDAYPMGEGFEHIDIDAKWSANSFVLKVRGDSMLPTLTEGAYIVVDPAVEWMHNRIVVVRQNGDTEVTVKRLVKDGDTYFLKPDNTNYRPMEMGKDAHICGVVVEQITKFV